VSPRRQSQSASTNGCSFALERFAWGGPDRLELAGTFSGLDESPSGLPVLVLTSSDRTHRLPAVAADVSGAPENGRLWSAAFVWQEPPAAFDAALLRLGSDLAVELPDPGSNGETSQTVELPVKFENGHGVERLRLEAELLAGREELREAHSALHRAEEELSRVRDDLRTEREERAADAVRFRAGLAQMRESVEEALLAKDAEMADIRGELEVATAFRAEAELASKAEIAALHERMEEARRRLQSVDEALGET
jgi:hypothetical protein